MKIVAIIPARGGSKGIPNKNIVDICGLPMIAYTINAALNSNIFNQVVVTTDNQDIKNVALSYGAYVIDRPSHLAQDNSSSLDAVEHALKYIIEQDNTFTHFALLQPTSPLRNEQHIIEAFDVYRSKNANSLVSVNLSAVPPQKTLVEINGQITPLTNLNDLTQNRQNLPKSYHPNGAIYISKIDNFLKDKNLFSDPLSIYTMDEQSSIDVDNFDDLEKVKNIFANLKNKEDIFTNLISLINKSLISKTNSQAYEKALEIYKTEDFVKVIDVLSRLDKLSFDEISLIGVVYFKLQEFEKSKPFLEYCINKDPKKSSKQSWLYYFNIIASQNDLEKCKDIINQVIKYNKMDIRFAKTVCTKFQNSELYEELELLEYTLPYFTKNIGKKESLFSAYARFLELKYIKAKQITDHISIDDVEILIPTYNRCDTIYNTIKQIKKSNEFIKIRIVDNCSTDNTWETLQKIHKEFKNIYISKNDQNMGYSYSMLKLLKECETPYAIFTSDEDPIIPYNLRLAIDYMKTNKIDFLSPIFIKKSKLYRGKPYIDSILPSEYGSSSFYTSTMVFKLELLLKNIDILEKHILKKNQVYPEVIMAILMIIIGKCEWYNKPLGFAMASLKTFTVTETGRYNGVMERWRQFTMYMDYFEDLKANFTQDKQLECINEMETYSAKVVMATLKTGARREFPQYKEYFI